MTTATVPRPAAVSAVLAKASTWTPARRKVDGLAFWIIPGSQAGTAYYTTASACNCPAARNSRDGRCKHTVAVERFQASQSRPAPASRSRHTTHRPCVRKACGAILPPEWPYQFCDPCAERNQAIFDRMAS